MRRSTRGDLGEQVVAERRLGLGHRVLQRRVAAAVLLEHRPGGGGRQAVVEADVQQRDAGALVALALRDDDQRAPVAATDRSRDLELGGDAVLRAPQDRVALGAERQVLGEAAAVDGGDRGAAWLATSPSTT